VEILKQDQYVPLPVEKQVLIIFAGSNRYLDDIEVSECRRFEREMYSFMETNYPNAPENDPREESDSMIRCARKRQKALDAFKERFKASLGATAAAAKFRPAIAKRDIYKNKWPHFSIIGAAFAP
jgi:F-type H+-transporting ATPase subunit alpha